MAEESQEGTESQEPQAEKDFIEKFKRISQENILRAFEKKNRKGIGESSLIVKDAFDRQWKKVIGNSYFQPITTIQAPIPSNGKNNTERSDPRSRGYMAEVTFSEIQWQKLRRKINKRFVDLFSLQGITADTKTLRPIFQNLNVNRLKEVLGEKVADKILGKAKNKEDHGTVKGPVDLRVEGFWEVMFSPAKDANDTVNIRLMWEGQCLVMKRMTEVVMPGFYLEVADHATRDHYTQTAKEGRKKIGVIQEYPYTVLREASMEEYLIQKSEGDRIMRDVRAREEG